MTKIIRLISLLVLFSLSSILYANTTLSPANNQQSDKIGQALFVMLSKEASVHATDKPGIYQLTLKGVSQKVVYFSNRPERVSGQITIEKLIAQWKHGAFSKDAPNAVIEAVKHDLDTNKRHTLPSSYAVVLTKPIYSSKHKNELSFEIKALPGNNATLLPTLIHSDYVAIFIDSVCLSCIG